MTLIAVGPGAGEREWPQLSPLALDTRVFQIIAVRVRDGTSHVLASRSRGESDVVLIFARACIVNLGPFSVYNKPLLIYHFFVSVLYYIHLFK